MFYNQDYRWKKERNSLSGADQSYKSKPDFCWFVKNSLLLIDCFNLPLSRDGRRYFKRIPINRRSQTEVSYVKKIFSVADSSIARFRVFTQIKFLRWSRL